METPIIPTYKDKVIYIEKDDKIEQTLNTTRENSYIISASFKGILRLSPNNATSISEVASSISTNDLKKTTYIDSVHNEEDTSVLSTGLKEGVGDADLTNSMLRVSSSDGLMVGLRIGETSVSADILNVVGKVKTKSLVICVDEDDKDKDIFVIGQTISFPIIPNKSGIHTGSEQRTDIEIPDITNDKDMTHVLVSTSGKYQYKKLKDTIVDSIGESLMSIKTIPTGSIHYACITPKQYEALLAKAKTDDGGVNRPSDNTDPLIRDFLLCDGSEYNNVDYPELAKILWNEQGTYLSLTSDGNNYQREDFVNNYGTPKKFRVPDLRASFIRSTNLNTTKLSSLTYTKSAPSLTLEDYTYSYRGDSGAWAPDVMPKYATGVTEDKHFHFSAVPTYDTAYGRTNDTQNIYGTGADDWKKSAVQAYMKNSSIGKKKNFTSLFTGNTNVITTENEIERMNTDVFKTINSIMISGSIEDYSKTINLQDYSLMPLNYYGIGGYQKPFIDKDSLWIKANGGEGTSCYMWRHQMNYSYRGSHPVDSSMWFSCNKKSFTDHSVLPDAGYSSYDIPCWKKDGSRDYGMYGKEATPEYYAMLPLIKI